MKVYDAADLERDLVMARREGYMRAMSDSLSSHGKDYGECARLAASVYPLPSSDAVPRIVPSFNYDEGPEA